MLTTTVIRYVGLTAGDHVLRVENLAGDVQVVDVVVQTASIDHTIRIESAAAVAVLATLSPGAEVSGAVAPTSFGNVGLGSLRGLTGAAATGSTGSVTQAAAPGLSGATAPAATGSVGVLVSEYHYVRISMFGATSLLTLMLPGTELGGADATAAAGAVAVGAEMPVTGAQAGGAPGSVSVSFPDRLELSGAVAAVAAGSTLYTADPGMSGATGSSAAGSVELLASDVVFGTSGALVSSGAGAVALSAQVPMTGAGTSATTDRVVMKAAYGLGITAGTCKIYTVNPVTGKVVTVRIVAPRTAKVVVGKG